MKKVFLLFLALLCLCACNKGLDNDSNISIDKASSSKAMLQSNTIQDYLNDMDTVYKQGANYIVLSDVSSYNFYYYIKDNDGYIIDEGYHGYRGSFDIIQENNFVTLNYGYGGNAWFERYYDISNGRVSRFFERPIQNNDELVAFFTVNSVNDAIVLIIQNKFDPDVYYKEVVRDFSDFVIKNEVNAEFIDNNTKLKITYWSKPDNEEITETIPLE